MSSSSRSKHNLSGGSSGFAHGRTKVVYGRRGRTGRSSGGHALGGSFSGSIGGVSGVPGVRSFSGRRFRVAGIVLFLVISGVIGAVSHHSSNSSHLSISQINRQLNQMQATLPTFDKFVSESKVMTALDKGQVLPYGMPTCPDNEPNVPGHTFICTFPVLEANGQTRPEQVKVTVAANQEDLVVGTPTAASPS